MPDLPVVLIWGLKATPLLAGAWLAATLLRRASAAARHFVWVLATTGVLALPAASLVAPRLEVAVPALAAIVPAPTLPAAQPATPRTSAAREAVVSPVAAGSGPAAVAAADPMPAPSSAATVAPAARLTRLWALGAALVAALIVLSLWRTTRLARRARPLASQAVLEDVRDVAARLGVRRHVRVLQAPDAAMPMTWGFLHPTVLVPAQFERWPAARRRAVLVHELAHVRRRDWLTQLGARLACALYWWNPLAWVAARRLREERELACDDLVLAHGTVPSAYAGDLLEIARSFRAGPTAALAGVAMARRSELAGRLLAVLDAARPRRSLTPGHAWSATAAAAVLLLPVAGLALGAGPGSSTPGAAPITVSGSGAAVESAREPGRAAPAALTPPPAQERSALLCDWSARGGSSSTSINDDRMMIQIGRDGCTLTVRADGQLTFTDDDRDLRQITDRGYFEIEEGSGRLRRRVEMMDAAGGLERRWFVDGREQAWNDDARAWLGDALLVLVRRTGINAEARATRILQTRGEDALMAEIALLQSDHVAGLYYRVLLADGKLTSAQTARLLADAAGRIESDHALGRVLDAVAARQPMTPEVRRAYVRATDALESDHEHSGALLALLDAGTPDVATIDALIGSTARIASSHARARVLTAAGLRYPADRALPRSYLDAVTGMDSDHERGQVLTALLNRDRLSPTDRAQVLRMAGRIGSSHTRSQVLMGVAAQGPLDDATRESFFAAVGGMDSDHSRQQVLTAVVAGAPDEAAALGVLEAARGIGSDHAKTQVLTALAAKGPMSDRVRAAYASVAQTIDSRSSRERALRAAGLQGM